MDLAIRQKLVLCCKSRQVSEVRKEHLLGSCCNKLSMGSGPWVDGWWIAAELLALGFRSGQSRTLAALGANPSPRL